jgi:hypothetical protein
MPWPTERAAEAMSHVRIRKFFWVGIMTAFSAAGVLASGGWSPAQASGWNVDQAGSPTAGKGYWALTYEANLKGQEFGLGACDPGSYQSELSGSFYECEGWHDAEAGYQQIVRNNAHTISSVSCYGATTWVYANSVGNYNYVDAHYYGTLNSHLANDENSAGIGNEC